MKWYAALTPKEVLHLSNSGINRETVNAIADIMLVANLFSRLYPRYSDGWYDLLRRLKENTENNTE